MGVSPERIVVAGAGLAGLRVAEELRARGYAGALTLVGAERRPPYDRPPLSKQVLAGTLDDTTLRAEHASLGLDLRLGETAVAVDGQVLVTDAGEHPFDRLVIATGARPVLLPGTGPQRVLRTLDDALDLRSRLTPDRSLAVVGAGWIGAELATAATAKGVRVTVVEAGPAPLCGAIGAQVGARTAPWYQAAGARLLTSVAVESVRPGGLALADGAWLAADEVVIAVGVRPETGWLAGSDLDLDDGVAVDEHLRTSRRDIYAVGDCASFWSVRFGRRMRPEHWDTALRAPAVVAANLLGESQVYDPVPYFWSEQFGRMLQYVGDHRAAEELLWRGDPAGQRWAACWLARGRLVALLTVGLPKDLSQGRRLISAAIQVDAERLTDPRAPLRESALA